MDKGDIVEIEIYDFTNDGKGIGKVDGLAVFTAGAVPGDIVSARITGKKKNYAFAEAVDIIRASEYRIESRCEYFGLCGGCTMMNLEYGKQLEIKRGQVISKLARIGGINNPLVHDTVANTIYGYRNKAEYTVTPDGKVGFLMRGSNKAINCEFCALQSEVTNRIASCVREYIKNGIIKPYDYTRGRGLLRGFIVRICEGTGNVMVVFRINGNKLPHAQNIVRALEASVDGCKGYELCSIVAAVQRGRKKHTEISEYKIIAGSKSISDIVNFEYGNDGLSKRKLKFEISPNSFYQVNTEQMRRLYAQAAKYADLSGEEVLLDIYCGIGTIGLSMADEAKYVIGIESVHSAVVDANRNAAINGIINAMYFFGRAEDIISDIVSNCNEKECKLYGSDEERTAGIGMLPRGIWKRSRVAILDPPRSGCDRRLLEALSVNFVNRIVYISCDPGTLARDTAYLSELGYQFIEATPFDMFPQTGSIETVALLSKLDVDKHIDVEIKLDELDLTSAESKATYAQIKEYVWNKFGLKVPTLYIAQIKKKCGIKLREHYNKSKKEKQVIPQCTPEKEEAIMDALRHFKMI